MQSGRKFHWSLQNRKHLHRTRHRPNFTDSRNCKKEKKNKIWDLTNLSLNITDHGSENNITTISKNFANNGTILHIINTCCIRIAPELHSKKINLIIVTVNHFLIL